MESSAPRTMWMSVKTVMTRNVISVRSSETVQNAWILLMEAGITGMPVVDEASNLVGVLSVSDIFRSVMHRFEEAQALRQVTKPDGDPKAAEKDELRQLTLAIRAVAESTVASILPKDQKVLSLSAEDSVDRAIHMMAEHSVNRLPVIHGTEIIGIVTRQDIIWLMAGRPGKPHEDKPAT